MNLVTDSEDIMITDPEFMLFPVRGDEILLLKIRWYIQNNHNT